jgi:uncharacterized membrane protein YfcA
VSPPFDETQIVLVWAGVIFASVLRSFTGFGFALAVVPVFAIFLPPAEVVVLAASLSLVLGLVSLRVWWGVFNIREILPLVLLAWIGTALGAFLLTGMSGGDFQLWAGIAVLKQPGTHWLRWPRFRSDEWRVGSAGTTDDCLCIID